MVRRNQEGCDAFGFIAWQANIINSFLPDRYI
jgi:hypothetical protein